MRKLKTSLLCSILGAAVTLTMFSGGDEETKKATVEGICMTPLMYEPGTKTVYSDVDYMVLGFVIEQITLLSGAPKALSQSIRLWDRSPAALTSKRKRLYFRRNLTPSSNSPIMIPADYKTFTKERVLCYLLTLIITT